MNKHRSHQLARLIVPLLAFAIMAACGSSAAKSSSTTGPQSTKNVVTIKDFAFSPSVLTVKVGTKVTWTNNDSTDHGSASDTGLWKIADIPVGHSASFTFTKAGTFKYHCPIHPSSMTATVVVTA